ncbi:hypothetical protein V2J09_019125 [Rumex salicifolius]
MNNNHQNVSAGFPPPQPAASAANGYPYAGPPPRPAYYYNNYNNNHDQANPNLYYHQTAYASQRATFFRRFVSSVIAVLVILTSILFIVWLVLRPRVPEFRINSLSVSQLNATSTPNFQIFGNWTAEFTALNPNTKMHAYYELIEGFVYYKSDLLAQNRLPPFDQGTRTETNVSAMMVAAEAYVDDWVVSGINSDRSHGSVKFDVRMAAVVHFQARGWRTRRRLLRVFCDGLPVAMPSKGGIGLLTDNPLSISN